MFTMPGSLAPRRCQLDQQSDAESKLRMAMSDVEGLGGSVDLTTMVMVIDEARTKLADIIDARLQAQLDLLGEAQFMETYGVLDQTTMALLMSDIS